MITVVQLDFGRVCHYWLFLLKSLPFMLKVRGPPLQPPLIISNRSEVDFQTVGSLSQQGCWSPGLLTPNCRETQPYTLAFVLFSNWKPTSEILALLYANEWLCHLWLIVTLLRNSNVPYMTFFYGSQKEIFWKMSEYFFCPYIESHWSLMLF